MALSISIVPQLGYFFYIFFIFLFLLINLYTTSYWMLFLIKSALGIDLYLEKGPNHKTQTAAVEKK